MVDALPHRPIDLPHQIIKRALERISNKTHWTRLTIARRCDGSACELADPLAVRFCAVGALSRAAHELLGERGFAVCYATSEFILAVNGRPGDTLPRINDQEGYATIIAMFEQALAAEPAVAD